MTTTEKKIHHAIADWVGDIVALETMSRKRWTANLSWSSPTRL